MRLNCVTVFTENCAEKWQFGQHSLSLSQGERWTSAGLSRRWKLSRLIRRHLRLQKAEFGSQLLFPPRLTGMPSWVDICLGIAGSRRTAWFIRGNCCSLPAEFVNNIDHFDLAFTNGSGFQKWQIVTIKVQEQEVANMYYGLEINSYRFWTASLISHASRGPKRLDEQYRTLQWRNTGEQSVEKDILEQTTATGTKTAHKPFVIK